MASLLNQDFGSLLNKCQREEIESYPWSFLFQTLLIYGSIPNTTGSVTMTQNSPNVIGTGTSFTANLAGAPGSSNCFWLWVGPTLTTPVQVNSITTNATLTLSAPWREPTQTQVSFNLQQLYYPIYPLQTVFRVRQIDDLIETSQAELNSFDPSRIATGGQPSLRWAMAPFQFLPNPGNPDSITNIPMIELWPRPASALPYIVDGKTGPIDMGNPTDLPMIPSQVLEAKAMMYACRAVFASSGNPKWLQMAQEYRQDYMTELEKAKTEDSKRIIPKGITSWGGRRLFDAAVDYDHDLSGPPDFSG